MALSDLITKGKTLVDGNSTTILTVMGVSGTITTAVLSGRASARAARLIDKEQLRIDRDEPHRLDIESGEMSRKDKFKLVWPLYIPPVVVGSTTVTSIIMANQLASKKIAALAVASSLSEKALQEYKSKVVEKLGENKMTTLRDEIAQDRVNKHPINTREVILAGTGEVLCYDMITGRYFQSTVEEIRAAVNKINYDILNHSYASLSSMYDEIGLAPTPYSDEVGWNLNTPIEVKFSTTMSTDQRPCIAVDFEPPPSPEYTRLY